MSYAVWREVDLEVCYTHIHNGIVYCISAAVSSIFESIKIVIGITNCSDKLRNVAENCFPRRKFPACLFRLKLQEACRT